MGGVMVYIQTSPFLAKKTQDIRDFRDFRIYDKLDVRFGREWKQAEVMEVDWEEHRRKTDCREVSRGET